MDKSLELEKTFTQTTKGLDVLNDILPGDALWPIVSCESLESLPQLDQTKRQLITWLTLPLAAQALNQLTWDPQVSAAEKAGSKIFNPTPTTDTYLEDRFSSYRTKLRAGNASVSSVHAAFSPEAPEEIHWLLPVGTSTSSFIIARTLTKLSNTGKDGMRRMSTKFNAMGNISKQLRNSEQPIPNLQRAAEANDPIIRVLKDPYGRIEARKARQMNGSY